MRIKEYSIGKFHILVHSRCQINANSFLFLPTSLHIVIKPTGNQCLPPLCVSFSAANLRFSFTVFHSLVCELWVQQKKYEMQSVSLIKAGKLHT